MLRKTIIRDLVGSAVLLIACLAGGLALNAMRSAPLPLVYAPPEIHLPATAETPQTAMGGPAAPEPDLDVQEMQKISSDPKVLIVDARPASFYHSGHIPSAVNLPREDFDQRYQALQSTFASHRGQTIVVYCAGTRCPDSQIVATALQKLGYPHVRVFLGGWNDWQSIGLPEEKE